MIQWTCETLSFFFLMGHQTLISFCHKLIERRNVPFWCVLVVHLASPAPPLSSSLNLSFFIHFFSCVSVPSCRDWVSVCVSPEIIVPFPHWLN